MAPPRALLGLLLAVALGPGGALGCKVDTLVPSARLKCVSDSDCPADLSCQEAVAASDGGRATPVKLCCSAEGCEVGSGSSPDSAAPGAGDAPISELDAPGALGNLPRDSGRDAASDAVADVVRDGVPDDETGVSGSAPDAEIIACATTCPDRPNTDSACQNQHCVYTCKPGYAACGVDPQQSGCATVVATAADNCGACGRSCAGCLEGRCPTLSIADKIGTELEPDVGAFDDKRLFFVARSLSAVMTVPMTGGVAVPVTSVAQFEPRMPRVKGGYLYWHTGDRTRSIVRMRLADIPNGPLETVVEGIINPRYNTVDAFGIAGDYVYWTVGSTLGADVETVQRRKIASGPIEPLLALPEAIRGVAFDVGGIFWDHSCCDQQVRRLPVTGVGASDFYVKQDPPGQPPTHLRLLGVDDGFVYWHEGLPGGGSLRRQAIAEGSAPETVVAAMPHELGDATVAVFDRGELLLVNRDGEIGTVVKAGGYHRTIALPKTVFAAFGLDATYVYWLEVSGSLWRTLR